MPGIAPGTGDTATTGSSPCLLGIMELVLRADGTEQEVNSAVLLTTPNQQQTQRSDRNSFHLGEQEASKHREGQLELRT